MARSPLRTGARADDRERDDQRRCSTCAWTATLLPSAEKRPIDAAIVADARRATAFGTIDVAQPYYSFASSTTSTTDFDGTAHDLFELIVDRNRIYYDADTTLIRQNAAAVIDRDDPTTLAWNYDWVNRSRGPTSQIHPADAAVPSSSLATAVHPDELWPPSIGST